jgi:hypothetical protein
MSLDQIVGRLIDDKDSARRRAIRLFEFQVAVFDPYSFRQLVASKNDQRAPSKLLRTARIFAAIRFLEAIEEKLQQENPAKPVSIAQLAENTDFQTIFDDEIAPNGGWRQIRNSRSVRSFDKKIKNQRKKANAVANYIDFSYRYDQYCIDPKRKGGITAACSVVRTASSYQSKMSRSTSKKRWSDFHSTAPFLYLLLKQSFDLAPPRVGSLDFSETLLKQVTDITILRCFFRAYQQLCEALKRQGYNEYDPLQCNLDCEIPQFEVTPFPTDVRDEFEKYIEISAEG